MYLVFWVLSTFDLCCSYSVLSLSLQTWLRHKDEHSCGSTERYLWALKFGFCTVLPNALYLLFCWHFINHLKMGVQYFWSIILFKFSVWWRCGCAARMEILPSEFWCFPVEEQWVFSVFSSRAHTGLPPLTHIHPPWFLNTTEAFSDNIRSLPA